MTRLSATNFVSASTCADFDRKTIVSSLLSGLLIIGLPVTFWLAVLELVSQSLSLEISIGTWLFVAAGLIGFSSLIWSSILISADNSELLDAEQFHLDWRR